MWNGAVLFCWELADWKTKRVNRKNSCSEAEMLVENMNKSKEFMFMTRNVIENMNKLK